MGPEVDRSRLYQGTHVGTYRFGTPMCVTDHLLTVSSRTPYLSLLTKISGKDSVVKV